MSFRFELAALRKEHEAQRVTLRKAEDELAALRKEHEAQRVALRKAEDESAQLRSENAQLRDGLDGLRRGAASSAAARPRLGGPAAAAAAVAPRKRLASAEAESKASSAPQAKRQAASAGSSTALSLIESAHLKPLGRAQPAQASSGAAPTLAAKARSAQLDAAPARQQVRPRRRSAARGGATTVETPRGESPGLVLLDLDHTLIHMLPRHDFPHHCAAHGLADAVVDLDPDPDATGGLVDTQRHRIAVRVGATALLEALVQAKLAVKVVTCNLFGHRIVEKIGASCGPPWAALRVVVVTSREPGAKSIRGALEATGTASLEEGEERLADFAPDRIAILDDAPEAWCADDLVFVTRVPRYDVQQKHNQGQLESEQRCLRHLGCDLLTRLGAAIPANLQ